MLNRTKKQRANMLNSFQQLHDIVVRMEKAHDSPPTTSLETEGLATYGHHYMMIQSLEIILDYLDQMSKAVFFCAGEARFITSDYPVSLHNPNAHRLPPLFRSPGLGMRDVELFFPLCPEAAFIASWGDVKGSKFVLDDGIEHLNRRTRFKCHKFFITHNGVTKEWWFDPGGEPDDSWENQQKKKKKGRPAAPGSSGSVAGPAEREQ